MPNFVFGNKNQLLERPTTRQPIVWGRGVTAAGTWYERCAITAVGIAQIDAARLAPLRQGFTLPGNRPVAGSLPRNTDEQTLAGLMAVGEILERQPFTDEALQGWGVLTGPCWPGTHVAQAAVRQLHLEGPRGASLHLIANQSLHAQAATISLILRCRGPVFGVSGTRDHVPQTLLAGLVMLHDLQPPGVWIVLSDTRGSGETRVSRAVALTLQPAPAACGLNLVWRPATRSPDSHPPPLDGLVNGLLHESAELVWSWASPQGELCLCRED